MRRLVRSMQKGLRQFQREVGDNIIWYELDRAYSTTDDTYGEGPIPDPFDNTTHGTGPGETFKAPKILPAVWIRFQAPERVQTDAGLYTIKHTSLRFSTEAMRGAGLESPEDPDLHYGDRYAYQGALYRVEQYEPKGWLGGVWIMIDVQGREFKEEELEADTFPFWQTDAQSTPWTPGQQLDWPATQPTDWENR